MQRKTGTFVQQPSVKCRVPDVVDAEDEDGAGAGTAGQRLLVSPKQAERARERERVREGSVEVSTGITPVDRGLVLILMHIPQSHDASGVRTPYDVAASLLAVGLDFRGAECPRFIATRFPSLGFRTFERADVMLLRGAPDDHR